MQTIIQLTANLYAVASFCVALIACVLLVGVILFAVFGMIFLRPKAKPVVSNPVVPLKK